MYLFLRHMNQRTAGFFTLLYRRSQWYTGRYTIAGFGSNSGYFIPRLGNRVLPIR